MRVLIAVLVAAATFLTVFVLANTRWRSIVIRPGATHDSPPSVAFTVLPASAFRVGVRGKLVFTISNLGDTPVRRLSVRGRGPWRAFHVDVVDVDGIFQSGGESETVGWFLFGQRIPAGRSRSPIVMVTPRVAGVYRFEFQAFDGETPLYGASGNPATATAVINVRP